MLLTLCLAGSFTVEVSLGREPSECDRFYAADDRCHGAQPQLGMVFQQPNPFPMTIFDNVAFALREQARKRPSRNSLMPHVEQALERAGLWHEVRDNLDRDNVTGKVDYYLNAKNNFSGTYTWNHANDDRADWTEAWKLFPGDVAYVYHAGVFASTVQQSLEQAGFAIRGLIKSPLLGPKGNAEFLVWLNQSSAVGERNVDLIALIESVVVIGM